MGADNDHHCVMYLDLDQFKIVNDTSGLASWAAFGRFLHSLKINDDMDFYQDLDERATRQ